MQPLSSLVISRRPVQTSEPIRFATDKVAPRLTGFAVQPDIGLVGQPRLAVVPLRLSLSAIDAKLCRTQNLRSAQVINVISKKEDKDNLKKFFQTAIEFYQLCTKNPPASAAEFKIFLSINQLDLNHPIFESYPFNVSLIESNLSVLKVFLNFGFNLDSIQSRNEIFDLLLEKEKTCHSTLYNAYLNFDQIFFLVKFLGQNTLLDDVRDNIDYIFKGHYIQKLEQAFDSGRLLQKTGRTIYPLLDRFLLIPSLSDIVIDYLACSSRDSLKRLDLHRQALGSLESCCSIL